MCFMWLTPWCSCDGHSSPSHKGRVTRVTRVMPSTAPARPAARALLRLPSFLHSDTHTHTHTSPMRSAPEHGGGEYKHSSYRVLIKSSGANWMKNMAERTVLTLGKYSQSVTTFTPWHLKHPPLPSPPPLPLSVSLSLSLSPSFSLSLP